ncbi:hypothetical protein ACSYAY_06635 [Leptospirillum ferriphilum]|jgi:hypothetical protein|uniref:hypothetical protein n=1 Tax=Leptospirillum ferriphilum TaxID=178606 RepID=UPI003EE5B168
MSEDPVIQIMRWLRPYLKEGGEIQPDGSWRLPQGPAMAVTKLITEGKEWLTHEARKKELKRFRAMLTKALDLRDKSVALRYLFPSHRDFPTDPGSRVLHDADALTAMIEECEKILGTREPRRYPRQRIVGDALVLWKKYTGRPAYPTASIPSKRERKKRTPSYRFCQFVLEAIEDHPPGDIADLYEKIASRFPKTEE